MWGIWGSFFHSSTSVLVNTVINLQDPLKVGTFLSAGRLLEVHSDNSCSCFSGRLFLAVYRLHIRWLDMCKLQCACACLWSTTSLLSSSPDLQWIMLLGLGLMKLSTFRKTHGSEHDFKHKHKWSEHSLMHVERPSNMQVIITIAFSGKILWWHCWTKVDYIESISRLLSVLKDKVPIFSTVAYCQKKKGIVLMIFTDWQILEEESEVLYYYTVTLKHNN